MRGQLYCGHPNALALSSSPVVSALGSELDDLGSNPGQGKALCPWDVRKKKCGKRNAEKEMRKKKCKLHF